MRAAGGAGARKGLAIVGQFIQRLRAPVAPQRSALASRAFVARLLRRAAAGAATGGASGRFVPFTVNF
jgi:hypothetical protein